MEQKRFVKNDCAFTCVHCGAEVLPMGKSSRNHCPFCLWSLHVDILPGDTPEVLQRRVMEQAEWVLLPQAAELVAAQIAEEKERVQ